MKLFRGLLLGFVFLSGPTLAQRDAQNNDGPVDYHDFFDVSNEAADEAFFHLERFFQTGFQFGLGLFTGGLGGTHDIGFLMGAFLNYFLDHSFAIELGMDFSFQSSSVDGTATNGITGAVVSVIEDSTTYLFVPHVGLRFYPNTINLSRFLALLNPYLVVGMDWVLRKESVGGSTVATRDSQSFGGSNLGLNAGMGISKLVYGNSLYLGADFRYRYWILKNESDPVDFQTSYGRDGDYITLLFTVTYDY